MLRGFERSVRSRIVLISAISEARSWRVSGAWAMGKRKFQISKPKFQSGRKMRRFDGDL